MSELKSLSVEDLEPGYEPDQRPFSDPVLRCDSCQALMKRETLHKLGCCSKCGNKRMRNVTIFNSDEKDQMELWGFQDFVNEFEVVTDVAE